MLTECTLAHKDLAVCDNGLESSFYRRIGEHLVIWSVLTDEDTEVLEAKCLIHGYAPDGRACILNWQQTVP